MTVLTEGQVEVAGLVMGRGTSYKLQGFNPWSRQVRTSASGDNPQGHGGWSGAEWRAVATIPFRIRVLGTSAGTWGPLHAALAAAFDACGTDGDVVLRWMTGGVTYRMTGRPRLVDPQVEQLGSGIIFTTCSMVALDPRIYSDVLNTLSISLPVVSGGLQLPVTTPFPIGSTITGGEATAVNAGQSGAGLVLRFNGPLGSPTIRGVRSDGLTEFAQLNYAIPAGQYVEVNTADGAHTVLLNGTTSVYGSWSGDWLSIPSGGSTLLVLRASDSTATGTLAASWRDTW